MNTQRLYEALSVARRAVVAEATAHLFAGGSRSDLAAALLAERLARIAFETAARAERSEQVAS